MWVSVNKPDESRLSILVCAPDPPPGGADLHLLGRNAELAKLASEDRMLLDALVGSVTLSDLGDTLAEGQYDSLVVATHGNGEGCYLGNDWVSAGRLAGVLCLSQLNSVLLMSCGSANYAELIARQVGAFTVGARSSVKGVGDLDNEVSSSFVVDFYRALSRAPDRPAEAHIFAMALQGPRGTSLLVGYPPEMTADFESRVLRELEEMREDYATGVATLRREILSLRQLFTRSNRELVAALFKLVSAVTGESREK